MKAGQGQGRCVVIVVGEASGDRHAAHLVAAMKKRDPTLFFCGIGGRAMRDAGVRVLMEAGKVSAVGVTESFAKLPVILRGMRLVRRLLRDLKPDLLILVDFPDFNLRVAPAAKRLRIPVLYYISPQLWAWRPGRAARLKALVDHMAVILPFEAGFYEKWNIPVTFVGHPLLDGDGLPKAPLKGEGGLRRAIGLLPGSREREVERHLPLMAEAAEILKKRHPDVRFIVSVAHTVEKAKVAAILGRRGSDTAWELSEADMTSLFAKVDMVLATSGTVTLEAALFGIPCVICYRVSPVSFWVGKRLIKVPYIGLANLIAGKAIQPELIQKEATPRALAHQCHRLLTDTRLRDRVGEAYEEVRSLLGGKGASQRTADIAFALMENPALSDRAPGRAAGKLAG